MPKTYLDMNALVSAWQDDSLDSVYYLDRDTGNVLLVEQNLYDLKELTDEIESNRDRYLYMPKSKSEMLKQDLKDFAETINDPQLSKLLQIGLESPNMLLAFKNILAKTPELTQMEEFRKARTVIRIKQWLSANCIDIQELPEDKNT